MKKFLLSITFLLAISANLLAQPKTVTDYFLAMPNNLYSTNIEGKKFTSKAAITKHRKSLIKIEDIKNGYLKLEGPWEGWAEIALFKKSDGSYIVGHVETGCGPVCGGSINFYSYKAGKWTDVTKKVLPEISEKDVVTAYNSKIAEGIEKAVEDKGMTTYFVLPRNGKIMKLECNECDLESSIMELEWNGNKFVKK